MGDVHHAKRAHAALVLGLIGLLAWPLAYPWVPNAGHNPDWIGWLVPVAEWGAIACAIAAIWLGIGARRAGITTPGSVWAPRVGWLTLVLMVAAAFLIVPVLYREA